MAKLFTRISYSEFKALNKKEVNKIYFIEDKGMIYANDKVYSHNTTDTVTTGGEVEVLAPTVNLTTKSQVTITNFNTDLMGINEFTLVNNCNVSNVIELGTNIKSYGGLTQLELSQGDVVKFVQNTDKTWTIEYIMGNKTVFPNLIPSDIKENEKKVMVMDAKGNYSSINFTEMKAWDNIVTGALTKAKLNEDYPDVQVGFQLVCSTLGKIYELIDATNHEWVSYDITKIS